jgi:two-component system, NtrC family, response regulator AtoC
MHGTVVDGIQLMPTMQVVLGAGSVVSIGHATIVVQEHAPAPRLTLPPRITPSPPPQAPRSNHASVTIDSTMCHLHAMLDLIAPTSLSVLVLGETGVGKELFAEEVHRRSNRKDKPFLQVNCAALAGSTLEAELFGFEKGAFTGAISAKPGLLEAADGGTLFLDEVGDMGAAAQVKLLRAVETGEVTRLGSSRARVTDVRIVSATNRNLADLVAKGEFRSDLLFRLNGMTFTIPPLRRRIVEIVPLAELFVRLSADKLRISAPRLTHATIELLEHRQWVGNIRELRNTVERAMVMCQGDELLPEHLLNAPGFELTELDTDPPQSLQSAPSPPSPPSLPPPRPVPPTMPAIGAPPAGPLRDELDSLERDRIVGALAACAGNQSEAARQLGMSRAKLIARISNYGIARPRKR